MRQKFRKGETSDHFLIVFFIQIFFLWHLIPISDFIEQKIGLHKTGDTFSHGAACLNEGLKMLSPTAKHALV